MVLDSEIHDICSICFWHDDPPARDKPDFSGGANGELTLRQAQLNYMSFGACDEESINDVRPPGDGDIRNPNWKLFYKLDERGLIIISDPNKIPKNMTEEEEVEFWNKHALSEELLDASYLEDEDELPPPKEKRRTN